MKYPLSPALNQGSPLFFVTLVVARPPVFDTKKLSTIRLSSSCINFPTPIGTDARRMPT